jgi:RNA polymerase sigma-70 factor (ECF subfamily)
MGADGGLFEPVADPEKHGACSSDQRAKEGLAGGFPGQLAAAREGSQAALGVLFESCRNYLLLIANRDLGRSIQAKIGASDLVQETFLQAQQIFDRFDGTSRTALAAWLAQILEFKLAQTQRRFVGAQMRDVNREESIRSVSEEHIRDLRLLDQPLPIDAAERFEELKALQEALNRLPVDYRLAIELRNLRGQSFAEIGRAMNRTADAARTTLVRAVLRLGKELRSKQGAGRRPDSNDERRPVDT